MNSLRMILSLAVLKMHVIEKFEGLKVFLYGNLTVKIHTWKSQKEYKKQPEKVSCISTVWPEISLRWN